LASERKNRIMAELILRPSSDVSTDLSRNTGSDNYALVDDTTSDGDTTYVYQSGVTNLVDKYNTSGRDGETGTINSITVYAKCKDNGVHNSDIIRTQIWSGSGSSQGAWGDYTTTSYADYSDEYTTSVDTSSAWTWDEVDSLQIGVRLRGYDASSEVRCTQVWAVVDYTLATTTSTTSSTSSSTTSTSSSTSSSTTSTSTSSSTTTTLAHNEANDFLLQEIGDYLLQEDNYRIFYINLK